MNWNIFIIKKVLLFLFICLIGESQAVALITNDEQLNGQATIQQAESRLFGTSCSNYLSDADDKPVFTLHCDHVVITRNESEVNIHFDDESESNGITFIVANEFVTKKGIIAFDVIGYYYRSSGKITVAPMKATGDCFVEPNDRYKVSCSGVDSKTKYILVSGLKGKPTPTQAP